MKPNLFLRLALGVSFALFSQATAQTIEVTSTGLGVGTSTPRSRLDIGTTLGADKGVRFGDYLEINEGEAVNNASSVAWNAYIAADDGTYAPVYPSGTGMVLTMATGGSGELDFYGKSWGGSATPQNLSTFTHVMRLATNGSVGIGTTAPVAKFHVSSLATGLAPMLYSEGDLPQFPATLQNISGSNTANSSGTIIGLNLENASTTSGTYSPLITFSRKSDSAIYNPTFAAIGALYTGQGPDSNWAKGVLTFWTAGTALHGPVERMRIDEAGNVGIGTTSPSYPLHVSGSVRATSFIANSATYADFVFEPGYKLAPLSEVEAAIKTHGHLPDIPSKAEAQARGIDLAEMQVKLLQKVEELTLYLVAHEKELQQLRAKNENLERKLSALEKR